MKDLTKELHDIKSNYEMGFTTSSEFLSQYLDLLQDLGAGDQLAKLIDEQLQSLATFVHHILNGSGKSIEDFKNK